MKASAWLATAMAEKPAPAEKTYENAEPMPEDVMPPVVEEPAPVVEEPVKVEAAKPEVNDEPAAVDTPKAEEPAKVEAPAAETPAVVAPAQT